MKLIEYKREHNGKLEMLGERDVRNMRTNHVYEGELNYVNAINSGLVIYLIKNEDIQLLKNGQSNIVIYSIGMKEHYVGNGSVSLAHTNRSYANGLLIDEMSKILGQYSSDSYSIITASDYGEYFGYTEFVEGTDYTKVHKNQNGVGITNISFSNPDMKDEFLYYELEDLFSVTDVLDEINALTIAKDVLFVHHENGVGYATRSIEKLQEISGYIFQNYLIA